MFSTTSDALRYSAIALLTVLVLAVWAKRHLAAAPPQPSSASYCANTQGAYIDRGSLWIDGFDYAPCKWLSIQQDV